MFLKNNRKVSKSIRAKIAITANRAMTIGVECVFDHKKTANTRHLLKINDLQTLPSKHGLPLRVVAEGHWGSEWVKYVYKVEFA